MKPVPRSLAAAFTNNIECPHCQARLEVGGGSRGVATVAGLFAAWLTWRATTGGSGLMDMVLPELYSIIVFGVVSALILMLTADLSFAPAAPVETAPAAGHGHAGHH
jgi:hypothetical protein